MTKEKGYKTCDEMIRKISRRRKSKNPEISKRGEEEMGLLWEAFASSVKHSWGDKAEEDWEENDE